MDEANYAENALTVVLPYALQSNSKVFFVSSATSVNESVSGHKSRNVLRRLRHIDDVTYDEVTYFCEKHAKEMVQLGVEALACECYCMIGQTKKHVHIANEDKEVMNTFQPNSFYSETISLNNEDSSNGFSFISGDNLFVGNIMQGFFEKRVNLNELNQRFIGKRIVIYVDTALCTNILSGIGIALTAMLADGTVVLVGVDQLFLDEKTVGHAALFVATVLSILMKTFKRLNGDDTSDYYEFYIVVEANLSDDMVVSICDNLKQIFIGDQYINTTRNIHFYTRTTGEGQRKLGFKLNKTNKSRIYTDFINKFNEGKVRLSDKISSIRVKNPECMIRDQLERIHLRVTAAGKETFSGKKPTGHTTGPADDMGLAIVISGWFAFNVSLTTSCWY